MKMQEVKLRAVTARDAKDLLGIYAPYVEKTAITFEYEVPSLTEFQNRIQNTLERYPYIAAVKKEEILGYAYTGPFVGRAAYDWSVSTSIYLREDQKGAGLGRRLYQSLECVSRLQNIRNMNACIGYPEVEDEYLTKNSASFHEHMGFSLVGKFHNSGYKFGRWYHMIWMEKMIGEHVRTPESIIPFPKLSTEQLTAAGILEREFNV